FTATPSSSPAGWLLVNGGTGPVSGTMTNAAPATPQLTVTINPAGLIPTNNTQTYFGSISIAVANASGTPQVTNPNLTIPVVLTVHSQPFLTICPAPSTSCAPTTLTFNFTTGEANTAPPSATLSVKKL